jgi:predicted branched-subunit amino acid permease
MRQLLVIGTVGAAMYLLSTTNVWGIGLGFVMLFVSLLLSTTVRAYGRESRNRRGF